VGRSIWEWVVTDNRLEYDQPNPLNVVLGLAVNFEYTQSAQKLAGFQSWLDQQIEAGILHTVNGDPVFNGYIDSAWKAGKRRALTELHKLDPKKYGPIGDSSGPFGYTLLSPVERADLELLFARDYAVLKGVTDDMSYKMGEVLSRGLSEGLGPRQIAAKLSGVMGSSMVRSETVARTEIIRSHHQSLWRQYKEADIEGITIRVEWSAAGDNRMCAQCAWLDGRTFLLDDMKDSIPLHPNCRCVIIPIINPASEGLPEYEDTGGNWEEYYSKTIKPQARELEKEMKAVAKAVV